MLPRVTLALMDGTNGARKYIYESKNEVVVGRALDCDIQLNGKTVPAEVSRHHCEFEIEPPIVRVRDLGSLNGTYVNGQLIGQREDHLVPEGAEASAFGERELKDRDEVQIGRVLFRVGIRAPRDARAPVGLQ